LDHLLYLALMHKDQPGRSRPVKVGGSRLAFLGEHVVELVLAEFLLLVSPHTPLCYCTLCWRHLYYCLALSQPACCLAAAWAPFSELHPCSHHWQSVPFPNQALPFPPSAGVPPGDPSGAAGACAGNDRQAQAVGVPGGRPRLDRFLFPRELRGQVTPALRHGRRGRRCYALAATAYLTRGVPGGVPSPVPKSSGWTRMRGPTSPCLERTRDATISSHRSSRPSHGGGGTVGWEEIAAYQVSESAFVPAWAGISVVHGLVLTPWVGVASGYCVRSTVRTVLYCTVLTLWVYLERGCLGCRLPRGPCSLTPSSSHACVPPGLRASGAVIG